MKAGVKFMRFVLGNLFFVLFILLPLKVIYDSWLVGAKLPDAMSSFFIDGLPEPGKIMAFRVIALLFGFIAIPFAAKGLLSLWRGKDFDEIP